MEENLDFFAAKNCDQDIVDKDNEENSEDRHWREFLYGFYSTLSSLKNYEDTKKSYYEGSLGFKNKNSANLRDFRSFLSVIEKYNVTGLDHIKKTSLKKSQLNQLNQTLSSVFKQKISATCSNSGITISGFFLSIKNVTNLDRKHLQCKRVDLESLNHIKVFAVNAIFIDVDVYQNLLPVLNRTLPVFIFAPKWEVIGNRKFNFSGRNAGQYHIKPATTTKKPRDVDGEDGWPGVPGEHGGFFFGVGEKFIGGGNLKIFADGGNGTDGEKGKDGQAGQNAYSVQRPDNCRALCKNIKNPKSIVCTRECAVEERTWLLIVKKMYCKYSTSASATATEGGNGGNGGAKGKGGHAGSIELIELEGTSHVHVPTTVPGVSGVNGLGGLGMPGGENKPAEKFRCTYKDFQSGWPTSWGTTERRWTVPRQAKNGVNGTEGKNEQAIQPIRYLISSSQKAVVVNEYKSFLRKSTLGSFLERSAVRFVEKLEANENIKMLYGIPDLRNDLMSLENQRNILKRKSNYVAFYESLLSRIGEYAKNLITDNVVADLKRIHYLYLATLSARNSLEENLDSYLIIDINEYLTMLKLQYESLKKGKKQVQMVRMVTNHLDDYKENIVRKQEEAMELINEEINDEIAAIKNQLSVTTNELLEEIMKKRDDTQANAAKKEKEREDLKAEMISSAITSLVDGALSLVNFLSIAGSVKVSSAGRDYMKNLKKFTSKIREFITKHVKKLLSFIKCMLDNFNSILPDGIKMIFKEVQGLLFSIDVDESMLIVESLQNELISRVCKFLSKSRRKRIAVTPLINLFCKLGPIIIDIILQFSGSNEKLEQIQQAIEEDESKFVELQLLENKIKTILSSTLQKIFEDVRDLESKSKVVLDIKKWKVQTALRNAQSDIKTLSKSFGLKTDLSRCIKRMEETLEMQINIYRHIQDYQEQKELTEFIANVQIATTGEVGNADYRETRDLEFLVNSNLIIHQYETAYEALKQFVFPFAHLYMRDLVVPKEMKLTGSIETLVESVNHEIDTILKKVEFYKVILKSTLPYLKRGEFNSRGVSTEPFFTWKNEDNKHLISEFLSGDEVILDADITKSLLKSQAVKFNVIELYLKTKDSTRQSKLDDTLKSFQIELTHHGDSHYKFNNKTYVIETNSQLITYYFEKNQKESYRHVGGAYEDLKFGDNMLSPYALWRVRLTYVSKEERNNITFADLLAYKDDVDLELGGHATYADPAYKANNISLNEDFYYKCYESRSDRKVDSVNKDFAENYSEEILAADVNTHQVSPRNIRSEDTSTKSSSLLSYLPSINLAIPPVAGATVLNDASLMRANNFYCDFDQNCGTKVDCLTKIKSHLELEVENNDMVNIISSLKVKIDSIFSFFVDKFSRQTHSSAFKSLNGFDSKYITSSSSVKKEFFTSAGLMTAVETRAPRIESEFNENAFGKLNLEAYVSNYSFIFAQFIASQKFGTNKALTRDVYVSPEQEKNFKIYDTSLEILPALEENFFVKNTEIFLHEYNAAFDWYKNIFRHEYEEINRKILSRKNKKEMIENFFPEDIFTYFLKYFNS